MYFFFGGGEGVGGAAQTVYDTLSSSPLSVHSQSALNLLSVRSQSTLSPLSVCLHFTLSLVGLRLPRL